MNRVIYTLLVLCAVCSTSGCKEDDSVEKIKPTNLTLEVTISTDGTGKVDLVASAVDANRYFFSFGDFSSGIESEDGLATYNYLNSGTYTITVIAYSVDDLFIDKKQSITIQVDEPEISDVGYTSPESYDGMTLVWNDEFNGESLNSDFWTHETGNGSNGWGNNELEYYQAANTIVQNGYLTIKAKRESTSGFNYTSSRIITKNKKVFKYGRVDIRAKLPKGQGIWPALWMLGTNISEVGWPKCGEIDIMELIGGGTGKDDRVYGTVHWDNAGAYASYGGNTTLTGGKIFADEFHVFSIVWTDTAITWYLDNVQYHVIDTTPAELSEFQKDYFFIFNVAVGGNWPGSPNSSTVFPQRMIVDYIRVFQ